ncbi:hypothetical protein [Embleya sp. NPDC059237]|uniref:hypothetical protein n=1 Tax=Embleya sp. NPDC059237 TaxID=3346784 RepID=UPI0036A9B54A
MHDAGRAREGPARLEDRTVVFEFEDDPLRARVLSMPGAVRVADTAQLHLALTPDLASGGRGCGTRPRRAGAP